MESMQLNHLLEYVQKIKERRGFDSTTIEEEFLLFSEEVGELAHEIWEMKKKEGEVDLRPLAYEIVDCLIFLLSIAGMSGISDLETYFQKKEQMNNQRFG